MRALNVALVAVVAPVLALAACAAAPRAVGSPSPPTITPAAPIVPRAPYAIEPGELGDPGIADRIPHHARLANTRWMWVTDGVSPEHSTSPPTDRPIVPVVGERGDHVRVVSTEDDAAIAVWIQRAALATTTIAPVQLLDDRGRALATDGVWLATGADIELGRVANPDDPGKSPTGGADAPRLREVTLRAGPIRATGFARTEALGPIWVGDVPPEDFAERDASLLADAVIRAAPRDDAPVLATLAEPWSAHVVAKRGDWREVELAGPAVRVRGFVRAAQLGSGFGVGSGSGTGSGYGISDIGRIVVPAGACLYDRADGEVVGVETATLERYGDRTTGPWGVAYVATEHWGLVELAVHITGERTGADGPVYEMESCAKPAAAASGR